MNKINEMLENDIVPEFLNFTLQEKPFDWSKVTYNDYNSFENVSKSFPKGWDSIPGFDLIIQDIANNRLLPSDEMNKLLQISNETQTQKNKDEAIWVDFKNFDHIFKKNL
jgi:hypothetical protein